MPSDDDMDQSNVNDLKDSSDMNGEDEIETIASEEEDRESEQARFDILTYPTDFTLEVLVRKYDKEQIFVPGFQRQFVWNKTQASRLIESFLLGLPVPPIYLYQEPGSDKQLLIDGQQRLKSIAYYFEGYFGEEQKGRRPVFRLTGLNEKSPYLKKAYQDLKDDHPVAFARLNDATLRAFVIKQLDPDDSTSIFHIFERLNTGGTLLKGQEIRNCVYHGPFNDLLIDLNLNNAWRDIFGSPTPQKHQRDVELILRFLALHFETPAYKRPMKDFLSGFMKAHQRAQESKLAEIRDCFEATSLAVLSALGTKPFHLRTGLNAAVFDAVFVAFARNPEKSSEGLARNYETLCGTEDFLDCTRSHTTDNDVISKRLELAESVLFEQPSP